MVRTNVQIRTRVYTHTHVRTCVRTMCMYAPHSVSYRKYTNRRVRETRVRRLFLVPTDGAPYAPTPMDTHVDPPSDLKLRMNGKRSIRRDTS